MARPPGQATQRDRRVVTARELTDGEREFIASAEVPAEYAYLDDELNSSQP